MSRLLIVTRPELICGFHLAGVEARAAATVEEAQQLTARWLDKGEVGLLAIDEEYLDAFDSAFKQRLAAAEQLPHLALPVGIQSGDGLSGRGRVAALLRQAVGIHITFQGEQI